MASYNKDEFLVCALGRELLGCKHIAVGSAGALHAAAALLAAELSKEDVRVSILGSEEDNFFSDGGRELFDCAHQGRIDAFVLGGGQIDGEANLNFVGVGDYPNLSVRWPGSFGSPVMYSVIRRVVLFREEHSTRVLVPRVAFISAPGHTQAGGYRPGGPSALVTGLCVFAFDRSVRRFRLQSLHPGHTLEEVRANTGFSFDTPQDPPETPEPSPVELEFVRGVVAKRLARTYPRFAATSLGYAVAT